MDISLTIEKLVPSAQYFGSLTSNTKEDYDKLDWQDQRTKPEWKDLQNVWVSLESQIKAEAEAKAAQKAALLERLGISESEARLLLS